LERTIQKSFSKGVKQSSLKMMGCRNKFTRVQEEIAQIHTVVVPCKFKIYEWRYVGVSGIVKGLLLLAAAL